MIANSLDIMKSLRLQLDKDPEDWDTRLVLADIYEEIGETVLSRGQRWQGLNRYAPVLSCTDGGWIWWKDATRCYSSSLMDDLFSLLARGIFYGTGSDKVFRSAGFWYISRQEAEYDLAQALEKTTKDGLL